MDIIFANPIINKTKIVATVGPASRDRETLKGLIAAGVDVFRLNFSHGSHADHLETTERILSINKEQNTNVAILADLQGPKIRLGQMENGPVPIAEGEQIVFSTENILGTTKKVPIVYETFAKDVKVGEPIKVDDGKLEFRVTEILNDKEVLLTTISGGELKDRKGVNMPFSNLSVPSMTEKDFADLEYILTLPVNWIALSFVRTAEEINNLKKLIEKKKHPARVIAKIEKPEAVENIDSIIESTHAIMVARGDLGVEIPVEDVPSVQKMIVTKCIAASKPVIIATQMMESMIEDTIPSRAEITDVANAIYDGTDAVMLSGETAMGKHPIKVVETMQRIIARTEQDERIYNVPHSIDTTKQKHITNAMISTAVNMAKEVNAAGILGMTRTGYTGFKLSSFRPKSPIFVFTDNPKLLNMFSLLWGIRAFFYDQHKSKVDKGIADVQELLKEKKLIKKGDWVVNTGSMPIEERGPTNFVKVTQIK